MHRTRRPLLHILYNTRRSLIFSNHERIASSVFTRPCSCTASLSSETQTPILNSATNKPPKPPADHRELATAQGLFTTSLYSPGSPLLLPNGSDMFIKLTNLLRSLYPQFGFREVITPNIYKKSLWQKSGHWENYAEDMFEVKGRGASGKKDGVEIGEDEEFGLKPMNCPGHCLLFASEKRSYRDLPVRFADFSALHRNEVSGALSGLTRVRRFHQDDGHIFCRPSQIEAEIRKTMEFIELIYGSIFNFGPYRLVLSTRPKENYIGSLEEWESAESQLKAALDHSGRDWSLNEGDGAFYGPKIDIILKDSDGKEHQTATIQLDFQLPQRFGLEYIAPNPELERKGIVEGQVQHANTDQQILDSAAQGDLKAIEAIRAKSQSDSPNQQPNADDLQSTSTSGPVTPVIIHRAILGSVERFLALMIEHYNGRYPFWISPRPVIILSVSQSPEELSFIEEIAHSLRYSTNNQRNQKDREGGYMNQPLSKTPSNIHPDTDISARSVGKKINEARIKGYNFVLMVGPKEARTKTVSLRILNQRRPDDAKSILKEWTQTPGSGAKEDNFTLNIESLGQYFQFLSSNYL